MDSGFTDPAKLEQQPDQVKAEEWHTQ